MAVERMGCSFYDVLYENVIGTKTDEQVKCKLCLKEVEI